MMSGCEGAQHVWRMLLITDEKMLDRKSVV